MYSSLRNSFEDRAPVDEIYMYPIFKWVAVKMGYKDNSAYNVLQGDTPY